MGREGGARIGRRGHRIGACSWLFPSLMRARFKYISHLFPLFHPFPFAAPLNVFPPLSVIPLHYVSGCIFPTSFPVIPFPHAFLPNILPPFSCMTLSRMCIFPPLFSPFPSFMHCLSTYCPPLSCMTPGYVCISPSYYPFPYIYIYVPLYAPNILLLSHPSAGEFLAALVPSLHLRWSRNSLL